VSTFPKSARLLKSHEYRTVRQHGVQRVGKYIIVQIIANSNSDKKLGISAPKQFGKAHVRNKFKRRIREIFRLSKTSSSYIIHVKPRPFAKAATFQQISDELNAFLSHG